MAATGKKRTTKSSSQSRKSSPKKKKNPDFQSFHGEIMILITVSAMILLVLSNFSLCGKIGNAVSHFFFGIFGWIHYILPIGVFFGTALLISNGFSSLAIKKVSLGALCLLMISAMIQMFVDPTTTDLIEIFVYSAAHKSGGGILGGLVSVLLHKYIGTMGAYVVAAVTILISFVLITETSFLSLLRKGSSHVYENVKESKAYASERIRENRTRAAQRPKPKKNLAEATRVLPASEALFKEKDSRGQNSREKDGRQKEVRVQEETDLAMPQKRKLKKAPQEVREIEYNGHIICPDTGEILLSSEQSRADFLEPAAPVILPEAEGGRKNSSNRREAAPAKAIREESGREIADFPIITGSQMPSMDTNAQTIIEPELVTPAPRTQLVDGPVVNSGVFGGTVVNGLFTSQEKDNSSQEPEQMVIAPESVAPKRARTKAVETGAKADTQELVLPSSLIQEKAYRFPPLDLLDKGKAQTEDCTQELKETALKLQQTLENFGVGVTITNVSQGPAVTRYEMQPEQGVKVSKIVGLTDDIKLNLAAADIRIEAPIPGKAAIGIEVPNKTNSTVMYRDLIEDESFKKFPSELAFAVGKDIGGKVVVTDIAKMPHLLIAGATGSGKSVCINTLIMSILYKAKPSEVKLIMIDPQVVELSTYNGIPHLLIPVVTDPKKASSALNWAVMEMTDRYNKFSEYNVRNLKGYNEKVEEVLESGDIPEGTLAKLPLIVIIVDELADLMMVAPGEVEDAIVRLSQLARAAGIHLVIATQRPSVNVITGLIKANVPSRIAFSVSSGVDSRTIIDMNGAEKLLGKGDMLFYPSGYQKPVRVQGAFVSDREVNDVVAFLKEQSEETAYNEEVVNQISNAVSTGGGSGVERDEYFAEAGRFIIEKDKASIGMLQRVYKIGFNRAARIMDQLAEAGVVGPEEGTKPRKVMMSEEEFEQYIEEYL